MLDAKDFEPRERKDLPKNATNRERLKYIKNIAIFSKTIYGDMSHNDIQNTLDKIIEVSNV